MRLLRWAIGAVVAVMAALFCAGAILAEFAMHPPHKNRASDIAELALNVAKSNDTTANSVFLKTSDGVLLHAWWLPRDSSGQGTVIVCHGVADSAMGTLGYASFFLRNGYSVLVPESRGHGQSGGLTSYGVQESDDIVRWVRWTKVQGSQKDYGFGESLGGSILLQSLGKGADFRAVVAESPYSSFWNVAEDRISDRLAGPAWFQHAIADDLLSGGMVYARWRYKVDLRTANTSNAIAHTAVPILLIHGLADNETKPAHSKSLLKADPGHVCLWLVPGAKHTGAYAADPANFEQKVLAWFREH